MARVKRPFKRYNSVDSILAVQVKEDNLEYLAETFNGRVDREEFGDHSEMVLRLPSLDQPLFARVGEYVSFDDDNQLYVVPEALFEQEWVVPKPSTKTEEESADTESE